MTFNNKITLLCEIHVTYLFVVQSLNDFLLTVLKLFDSWFGIDPLYLLVSESGIVGCKHEGERMAVTKSLFQAIQEFKKGKVEYRVDKTGIVHLPFGKINFSDEDLIVNLVAAVVCIFFVKELKYFWETK